MAKTKLDIMYEAAVARKNSIAGGPGSYTPNPYKEGSWQYTAWEDGDRRYVDVLEHAAKKAAAVERAVEVLQEVAADIKRERDDRLLAELGEGRNPDVSLTDHLDNLPRDTEAGVSAPFPVQMPSVTREHIRRLEASYKGSDGARMVRVAKKIEVLYARHR